MSVRWAVGNRVGSRLVATLPRSVSTRSTRTRLPVICSRAMKPIRLAISSSRAKKTVNVGVKSSRPSDPTAIMATKQ